MILSVDKYSHMGHLHFALAAFKERETRKALPFLNRAEEISKDYRSSLHIVASFQSFAFAQRWLEHRLKVKEYNVANIRQYCYLEKLVKFYSEDGNYGRALELLDIAI